MRVHNNNNLTYYWTVDNYQHVLIVDYDSYYTQKIPILKDTIIKWNTLFV